MDAHLDGNSLAGMLGDYLRFEATTAVARCIACGDVGAVAEAMVYGREQGRVVRCKRCDAVLITVVPTESGNRRAFRGCAWLEVP
jgi:Family of unknown function (DUF6510)